jgi:hypothetical protein
MYSRLTRTGKLGVRGEQGGKSQGRTRGRRGPKIWDGGTRCAAKVGRRRRQRSTKTSCKTDSRKRLPTRCVHRPPQRFQRRRTLDPHVSPRDRRTAVRLLPAGPVGQRTKRGRESFTEFYIPKGPPSPGASPRVAPPSSPKSSLACSTSSSNGTRPAVGIFSSRSGIASCSLSPAGT